MSNSLSAVHPELIAEWAEKNLPLTPDNVTFGSNKKVSSFCCLPIITIGVVDYRHCNQKNLKIYLSTLHKSV